MVAWRLWLLLAVARLGMIWTSGLIGWKRVEWIVADPAKSAFWLVLAVGSAFTGAAGGWCGLKVFVWRLTANSVTPAVYPRLVEFLHFDIQSTGQKSHCVKTNQ